MYNYVCMYCSILTSTASVLCSALRLALVKATGLSNVLASSTIKGLSGIRKPTVLLSGLRQGLRVSLRSNIRVTGPGKSSLRRSVLTVLIAHL